jgi:hypothetical protein
MRQRGNARFLANRRWGEMFSVREQERWRYCFDLVRDRLHPVRLATRVGTQGKVWLDCEALVARCAALMALRYRSSGCLCLGREKTSPEASRFLKIARFLALAS